MHPFSKLNTQKPQGGGEGREVFSLNIWSPNHLLAAGSPMTSYRQTVLVC